MILFKATNDRRDVSRRSHWTVRMVAYLLPLALTATSVTQAQPVSKEAPKEAAKSSAPASSKAAEPLQPVSAKMYRTLTQTVATDAAQKIEVLEFFWYECPHCNEFEPMLEQWQKRQPRDVVVKRVPVAFRDDFTDQQRMFYTLEAMGRMDLHVKVFQEVHGAGNRMRKPEQFADFVEKNNIDRKKFMEVFQSFAVQTKVAQAKNLANLYKIESVPSVAIDGRYVTNATIAAGSHHQVLQVVEHLLDQTRKATKKPAIASSGNP